MNRLVGSYSMLPDLPVEVTGSGACKPTRDGVEAVFLRDKEADQSGQRRILDKFGATCGCQHVIRLLRGLKRLNRPNPIPR